ncbi:histone lysine methyltransferase Set9 [Coemansia sp. RSA 1290]|nr:histone lysine methyltransferase Set9 [Coemansia sp. RSA 1086]KAJ1753603.1 histone lysine methyltransferase Set9 [Coemansia sp. RSA 1821]KAJ1876186.1 histone lysine methyltransferase Set9 [Coemansia sp. RSA 990]KAJ2633966.1 histone lysine methyltransferase Set9 [Coemansia sp. RSA 1290]KAJ2652303.1 histone lysine methyltransferase Set9 [Coemansia sp. RSA 1250]KAJ2675830.1 histone lysine methyltransferase Set9 [Coemansia sp. RSA 1085]
MPPGTGVSSMDALTLSQYDDLLSDVLLDKVGLWFQTRKMFPRYRSARINANATTRIVQQVATGETELAQAVDELLKHDYIVAFLKRKSKLYIENFRLHAGRYISMYLPEAGYEIAQTDRYKVVTGTSEARVVATKRYELGMVISLCSGSVAKLSEKETQRMAEEHADFSVIWWQKQKSMCLFLGPARFVNHDCNPNCQFTALGSDAICFQALRTIEPGEEITTHYGNSYFGAENCECLCATCEKYSRGWFAHRNAGTEGVSNAVDESQSSYSTDTETTLVNPTSSQPSARLQESTDSIRMRTRNKGCRSVTPASCLPSTSRKQSTAADDVCSVCGEKEHIVDATEAASSEAPGWEALKAALLCQRCARHQLLFGCRWPTRPQPYKKRPLPSGKRNGKRLPESSNSSESGTKPTRRLNPANAPKRRKRVRTIYDGDQGPVNKSAQEMFAELAVGTPVLVDPLDEKAKFWWPGVIVNREVEAAKQDGDETEQKEIWQVRYFEDGSFSMCQAHEMLLFDPTEAPFTKWMESLESFVDEPAIRRALAYYEWRFLASIPSRHEPPKDGLQATDGKEKTELGRIAGVNASARLKHIYHSDCLEQLASAMDVPEIVFDDFFADCDDGLVVQEHGSRASKACVQPYLLCVRDKVTSVDARDGKLYKARIEQVDFVNNSERLGLYYYLHYFGWNSRYDEWVSPCQIVALPSAKGKS